MEKQYSKLLQHLQFMASMAVPIMEFQEQVIGATTTNWTVEVAKVWNS